MITADARSRITPNDLDLLASCLGSPSRAVSLDAVLDRREVATFLLRSGMPGPSPSLLFYVLVRHSALRTAFAWEHLRRPRQVVLRVVDLPWKELDWRGHLCGRRYFPWREHRRSARIAGAPADHCRNWLRALTVDGAIPVQFWKSDWSR